MPSLRGIEVRDRNHRNIGANNTPRGEEKAPTPARTYWQRYEIENYLLNPEAILRFLEKRGGDDMKTRADEYMRKQWPPVLYDEPFADNDFDTTKGKNIIAKLMENVGLTWDHKDCVNIAEEMTADEVHPEVREKLDRIAEELDVAASE